MQRITEIMIFYILNALIYYIYSRNRQIFNNKYFNVVYKKYKYINKNILNNEKSKIHEKLIIVLLALTSIIMMFKGPLYAYIFYLVYIYTIYIVIDRLVKRHKEKLVSEIPMFFMSIKNNFKITNDIIKSLCNANKKLEISKYFKNIEYEIETGKTIEMILSEIQTNLELEELNTFFIIIVNCYKYGGNYRKIIENEEKIIVKNKENRNKFIKKEKEIDTVIIVFIIGNIFLVINNCFMNYSKITNIEKIIYYIDILIVYLLLINFKMKKEM